MKPHVKKFAIITAFVALISFAAQALAQDVVLEEKSIAPVESGPVESPQRWSVELKGGFWLPKNSVMKEYFTDCCNIITKIEGGILLQRRYGFEAGVGFMYKSAAARATGGRVSQDRFDFITVPAETNFVWRADYFDWRYIIPFVRTGVDYVYYREGDIGRTIQGVKFGLHGGGGLAFNIGKFGDIKYTMDADMGINELFITIEGQYQWINNFGSGGLDLSGGVYSLGFLFEF